MKVAGPSGVSLRTIDAGVQTAAAELLPVGARILVPLDFSALSKAAADTAVLLAENRPDVTLCFVHVVNNGPRNLPQRMQGAWMEMSAMLEPLRCDAGLEKDVLAGPPARTLCELCEREEFALIVMTSHGRTGLARMIMGSVAEDMVQEAPVSVLVVKPRLNALGCMVPVAPTFKHLIVGYDHREGAERALCLACSMAKRFHSRVTLVHAVNRLSALTASGSMPDWSGEDALLEEAKARLQEVCGRHPAESAPWKARVAVGCPCNVLKDAVTDAADDLVIVGPHEFTRWGHCFCDSSACEVARLMPCSVLVAR